MSANYDIEDLPVIERARYQVRLLDGTWADWQVAERRKGEHWDGQHLTYAKAEHRIVFEKATAMLAAREKGTP